MSRSRRIGLGLQRLSAILWLCCTLFIIYGTTIPFHFTSDRQFIAEKLSRVTLNPLISPDTGRRVSIPDVAQNVLLFVPFGFFGYLTVGEPGRSATAGMFIPVALAALLSAGVETLQLFTIDRTTAASDLAADTTGAICGALAARMAVDLTRHRILRPTVLRFASVPASYPLMIATVVLLIAAWEPFDVTFDVGNLLGKLHSFRLDPWHEGALNYELIDFLRYALFGLTASVWLQQAGVRAAGALAAVVGIAAAAALEASQWLIESRVPGIRTATIHASGAVAGVIFQRGWPYGRSAAFWCAALVIATWAGVAWQMSSPLSFHSSYAHTPVETIWHALEVMLLYFPLGFSFQLSLRKRSHAWAASVAVALVVELALWATHSSDGGEVRALEVVSGTMGSLSGAWAGGPGRRAFYRSLVTKPGRTVTS